MSLFKKLFAKISRNDISTLDLLELESLLIEADLGAGVAKKIIENSKSRKNEDFLDSVKRTLSESLSNKSREISYDSEKPTVILIVGVNGTGKTTSAAKLANYLKNENRKVMIAAADTFRAAAVAQIQTWGERLGIPVVFGNDGADPAAVAFDAAKRSITEKFDYLIIDTAGRLHTKDNLMAELEKVKRVVEKIIPVNEVLFVLDGTTGQNGLAQAQIFNESVGVTGLIVTKLDGSAKGGIAIATEAALDLPIKFIGTGETLTDFARFESVKYLEDLTSL
ncbi:MAG: signal recognition particle-docking protein FtsY [Actinomycetes bacterium]|jgi:fused signal recognition particle receptor